MSPSFSIRVLATQSDARLVALAREGQERAFEALVQRYRRPLLAYCRRLLLPESRAEDALQQALLAAWLSLQRGTEVRDPRAWLYRIVHNSALNALRASGYDYAELTDALHGALAPEEDLGRRIAVREALAGLAALPELQREVLLRTAVEGDSHEAVAAALGLSGGAVRGLVHRARATMRTAVTAITPTPVASWLASSGTRGTPLVERIAELSAGGGSVGVAGVLIKGGAVAVTAGALVTGLGPAGSSHGKTAGRHRDRDGPAPSGQVVLAATTAPRAGQIPPGAIADQGAAGHGYGAAPVAQRRSGAAAPIATGFFTPTRRRHGGSGGGAQGGSGPQGGAGLPVYQPNTGHSGSGGQTGGSGAQPSSGAPYPGESPGNPITPDGGGPPPGGSAGVDQHPPTTPPTIEADELPTLAPIGATGPTGPTGPVGARIEPGHHGATGVSGATGD